MPSRCGRVKLMDTADHLAAIERESAAFRAAAKAAGLDAGVAACPGWTVADLVWHLTEVHYFWGAVVAEHAASWQEVVRIDRVGDDELFDAFDTNQRRL